MDLGAHFAQTLIDSAVQTPVDSAVGPYDVIESAATAKRIIEAALQMAEKSSTQPPIETSIPALEQSSSSINLLCFTWNVGNKHPIAVEIDAWIPVGGADYDLVVVGTQENSFAENEADSSGDDEGDEEGEGSESTPASRLRVAKLASKSTSVWDEMVLKKLGVKYAVCQHEVLKQMRLTVYARIEHLGTEGALITGVQAAHSATGIGGVLGNKGGLIIKLNFGPTSLAFVSCHLAAHSHKLQRRNSDCQEVRTRHEPQSVLSA